MDWGHAALAGVIILVVVSRLLTRKKRSLKITIDWEEEGNDPG